MRNLKFGDLVVGNEKADEHYGITTTGTKWIVAETEVLFNYIRLISKRTWDSVPECDRNISFFNSNYYILGGMYTVNLECFDFVESLVQNKHHKDKLERYDEF